jgi:dTDP-4-amino-4,6-dideoxygalactose transaminase
VLASIAEVYDKNWFILGKELESFEKSYAEFTNTRFCIGVGNGHDALFIALKVCNIGPGDEVIVPAHTFIATWLAVTKTGAAVRPVDVDPSTFNLDTQMIESAFSMKTRAIIPVHLYGQPCDMSVISSFANQQKIFVIEDNAQAHGATWKGKATGSFGHINGTSFYPVKNLGALGDGGAITTDNELFAKSAMKYRNYGFEQKNVGELQGINSRLDEIQAAVLKIKLDYLQSWNEDRIRLAELYIAMLDGVGDIQLPVTALDAHHVYHLFVMRTSRRDALREYLAAHQVETMIHYPIPPHLQQSYKDLRYKKGDFPVTERIASTSISLPLWPGLSDDQIEYICELIKKFFS